MDEANMRLMEAGLREYGVSAGPKSLEAVVRHLALVAEWNEQVNLTAITGEREMVLKHAVDSASSLSLLRVGPGSEVADIGPGAGFPGVVLKCLVPGIRLVSIESLAKRCRFLETVGREVIAPLVDGGNSGYEVVWGRAEDVGQDGRYRGRFDVVVARAVAELSVLCEYCLPFAKVGGVFLAMKGPAAVGEVQRSENALRSLGGVVEEVRSIELPEEAGERTLIRIRKVAVTPPQYPRKAGTPSRHPL